MGVSTKKGDEGFTSLYLGGRISKGSLITEANGAVDEASSQLGLARAATKEKRIKRILVQIQNDLFIIGAEISTPKDHAKKLKKRISDVHVAWLEKLVEEFEEALALPPGFVAFGQKEGASHLDVARTGVRRAERLIVRMKNEDMIENSHLLRYLNRLSDLVFLLAAFEEADEAARNSIRRKMLLTGWREPFYRRWTIIAGTLVGILIVTIILLLLFHGQPETDIQERMDQQHMESMHPRNQL